MKNPYPESSVYHSIWNEGHAAGVDPTGEEHEAYTDGVCDAVRLLLANDAAAVAARDYIQDKVASATIVNRRHGREVIRVAIEAFKVAQ